MAENVKAKKSLALKILARLKRGYPKAKIALNYSNNIQFLVAVILSAQCTDKKVNEVTVKLFKKYKTAREIARASHATFEREIKSTGFFRAKTKSIISAAKMIEEKFGGKLPQTMAEMVKLPGVGRKTANIVLGNAYGVPGLTVDTHMIRLNRRLGLTQNSDPVKIEFDLMKAVPQEDWTSLAHLFIDHGRAVCKAPKPRCEACKLTVYCDYYLEKRKT